MFFFWNHFKVAWGGSEQLETVSFVTCGESLCKTSIAAAPAHQTFARGLSIGDACCLTICLDNLRISSISSRHLSLCDWRTVSHSSSTCDLWVFLPWLSFLLSSEAAPTSCLPCWLFIWYWAQLRWQRHDVVHPQGLATCRLPRCSWTSWTSCRRSEIMRPKGGTMRGGGETKDEFQGWSWNMLWWFVFS